MNHVRIFSSPFGSQVAMGFRLIFFGLLLKANAGLAQLINQTTIPNAAEIDSARGYWRLNTQATTRSTIVQFFGTNRQLLYEEILPEKWVKLTRKNQRQFDQLLDHLVANQLLTARIETEPLPPTSAEPVLATSPRLNTAENSASAISSYRVHAYINPNGKLYVIVNNPDRLRYAIKVVDQHNQSLYEEFTNLERYRRKLDVSSLTQHSYQVVVRIDNKPYTYKVKMQDTKVAYSLQPSSVTNQQIIPEPNREETKPSATLNL
ncbi:hypothetical protein GCM10028805_30680 [Spirosoma harenae]